MSDLPKLVMVVDDHMNMRRTIRNLLKKIGCNNIVEAENGSRAWHMLKTQKIDLIVCDWNMEGMTGFELLQLVRKDDALKDTPFLMITAEVAEETVALAAETDVDAYIIKPFVAKTLEDKMIEAIERRKSPSLCDTHLKLGKVMLDGGMEDQAKAEFEKALKVSPRSPRAHHCMGEFYAKKKDIAEAEKWFKKSIELNNLFLKAYHSLKEICMTDGRYDQAIDLLKKAATISPYNPTRQVELGQAYLKKGKLEEARKVFNTALSLGSDDLDRKIAIGELLLEGNMAVEAEKVFKEAIESHSDSVGLHNKLGIAYRQQGKIEEAIAEYRKATEIDPDDEIIHYNLAKALLEEQNPSGAVDELKKAIALSPEFEEAKALLDEIKNNNGSGDKILSKEIAGVRS